MQEQKTLPVTLTVTSYILHKVRTPQQKKLPFSFGDEWIGQYLPLWQTATISGKKKGDDCPQGASLALKRKADHNSPEIISAAAVHSHATAFTRSSLQTEAEQPSKVLTVQQMSQLRPGFIAPRVLLVS